MTRVKCWVGSMIVSPAVPAPEPAVEPCPIRFIMRSKPLTGVKIDYAALRNEATRGTKTRRQHELAAARASAKAAKATRKT